MATWKDRKAFDAHDAAPWTKQYREKIQPLIGSPQSDERCMRSFCRKLESHDSPCRVSSRPQPPSRKAANCLDRIELIHSVADLDKSVSFYRDALGLELKNAAVPVPRYLNDALSDLTNTHGASFRAVAFKIPDAGFDLELTEFTGIDRTRRRAGIRTGVASSS